jgi:large subunit ribosomal protein L3
MTGILGKKLGMSQYFDELGNEIPVTVLQAEPANVIAIREKEKHGYEAVQIGAGDCNSKRLSKPVQGQFSKAGVKPKKHIIEFGMPSEETTEVGSVWDLSILEGTKKVAVTGTSKGRGFAGTVRRYGFTRGPMTHGSHNYRAPGSIGACSYPARVFPGQKLPGQYGNKRTTVRNLKVIKLDVENNLILVKGAVPGPINGTVVIRKI